MTGVFSQVDLRCDRCKHNWRDHRKQGCLVSKVHWDDETSYLVKDEPCDCKWYVGELPPPDVVSDCPHEYQDESDDEPEKRTTCVHCGFVDCKKKVKK
jgi:hypothetical protein